MTGSPPDLGLGAYAALGLLGALAVAALWWQRQRQGTSRDQAIKLIDTLGLGAKRALALVEVERERFLLGLTDGDVTCLARLERSAFPAAGHEASSPRSSLASAEATPRVPPHGKAGPLALFFVMLLLPLVPAAAEAAVPQLSLELGGSGDGLATSIQLVLLFTLLSFAPAILIGVSAFVRIVIVLAFVRQAVGTQQMPPNQVIVALALFLTFFVMMPTLRQVNQDAIVPYLEEHAAPVETIERGFQPLRAFMLRQTREKDLALFLGISDRERPATAADVPAEIVIPAFMISELKTAFQISFLVYIPFLVLDMVVASILTSMGMITLPPVLISLPFKLMIFVLVDGWNLLISSLIRSFQ
jgi:flagellar biosynthetic protein FliP